MSDRATPARHRASAAALVEVAEAAERQGQREHARQSYERALRLLRTPAEAALAARIARQVARTYRLDGDFEAAEDSAELSLAIAERNGDAAGAAHALNVLGSILHAAGDLDGAQRRYTAARQLAAEVDDLRLLCMLEQNLGIIANIRGNLPGALQHYERCLVGARTLDLPELVGNALNNLGMLHTDLRRWEAAEQCYADALRCYTRAGDVSSAVVVEGNRVELCIARGDYAGARAACEAAFEMAYRVGEVRPLGELHKHSGVILRELGDHAGAEQHLQLAAQIAGARLDRLLAAETAREQAELYRRHDRNRDTLQALNRAHRFFSQLRAERDLADVRRQMEGLEASFLEIVRRWSDSIESKDLYTQGHCSRVAEYACVLAEAAGFDAQTLFWFRLGALLHDVGKLEVPSELLNKPGAFTPAERAQMERHAEAGVELLAGIEFPWDIRPMVRHHHERWEGGGYPTGIAGERIPLSARILCIADVYDALTTDRPYRPGFSHEQAMEIMRTSMRGHFDPWLFAHWERLCRDGRAGVDAALDDDDEAAA